MNASAFAALRLRARGRGKIRVNFGTPDTVPPEEGGKCKQRCWDTHSKVLELTSDWVEYVIPFDRLQQGGWGTQARFDSARLLSLNFSASPEAQPVDFWIDDLSWLTAADLAAPTPAAPASGVPSTTPAGTAAPSAVPVGAAPRSTAPTPATTAPTPATTPSN
jgi:hypothetical protein